MVFWRLAPGRGILIKPDQPAKFFSQAYTLYFLKTIFVMSY
ncbi:MAG: hypothetical protein JWP81_3489 [Ferruginibacter sp.]|nr:hypothetical protein [Ferruginibacter sp.]